VRPDALTLSPLARTLERVLAEVDPAAGRARDPVRFAHAQSAPEAQALVGLFAALLAYGRVDLIGRALTDFTGRLGPDPVEAATTDTPEAAAARFHGFVYRLTRAEDLVRLWLGAGALFRSGRTLEDAFVAADLPGATDLRPALAGFRRTLLAPTAHFPPRKAFEHFFPDPARGSATKRLWLYLRWMVRGPDAVDLGLWGRVSPARLTMPVDTHIHRLATYLGLTTRPGADARTAAEITAALRAIAPADPLRYDFGLTHLGIAGDCARRHVPQICDACPLNGVCRLDTEGRVQKIAHS
jgi:uncharacterized protein (TIGR02757 family)